MFESVKQTSLGVKWKVCVAETNICTVPVAIIRGGRTSDNAAQQQQQPKAILNCLIEQLWSWFGDTRATVSTM